MKFSLILSLTLLGLSTAACTPKHNRAGGKAASKTTAKPAVAPAPATAPVAAVSKNRGGRGGQGRGGRGGQAPPAAGSPPPAQTQAPAASSPPPASSNGNDNTNKNNNGGGGGGGSIPADLVPQFGIQAGVNNQNGNCDGLNNIKIPCACPPDRNAFIAKMQEFVNAGNAEGTPITFPTDDSLNSQITRLTASIVTLQNFNGRPGSGCPASSTTFVGQRAALLAKLT